MIDKEYYWTQESYSQWLKDTLPMIIEAEHEKNSGEARRLMENILKTTSVVIKQGIAVPPDLLNYLIGRFDCYFAELEAASKLAKKEVTGLPEKLTEALHLNGKRPHDHIDPSVRLSILSKIFCDAFYEAQALEEKSNLRSKDRLDRITPPLRWDIEKSYDYRESFYNEGFILGSTPKKKKITTEDIKLAFIEIMGIPEGTIKSYGTKYNLYRFNAKPKEAH